MFKPAILLQSLFRWLKADNVHPSKGFVLTRLVYVSCIYNWPMKGLSLEWGVQGGTIIAVDKCSALPLPLQSCSQPLTILRLSVIFHVAG